PYPRPRLAAGPGGGRLRRHDRPGRVGMNLLGVETVVRERLGLDPAALGPSVFPRAVETRMRATGITTPEGYVGVLATDPGEADALAAGVVVAETWFFRGGHALFDRLVEFIVSRAAARPPGIPVRVLSLPCSSGEEPFSLAIALHDHRVPVDDYTLDAVD